MSGASTGPASASGGGVRLRQVAVAARDLAATSQALQEALGLPQPYRDPGIIEFGLDNAVFAAGDTFLEVVAPIQEGTAAGRHLDRRGGDAGYMALFDLDDLVGARARLSGLGVRVVWQVDLDDMAGTHLHPNDVPGAIVSLDHPEPRGAWRWAGPRWVGGAPADREPGGITSLTVAAADPAALAARWAAVLGLAAEGTSVDLDGGRQRLSFVGTPDGAEGILAVGLTRPGPSRSVTVAGVRLDVEGLTSTG